MTTADRQCGDTRAARGADPRRVVPSPRHARAPVTATLATVASVLPVFLAGSLSVGMQADLGFGDGGLGAAVCAFYAVGGLVSWRARS